MYPIHEIANAIQHLFFPHVCKGCISENLSTTDHLCMRCMMELPYTGFAHKYHNAAEKAFWGRVPIKNAMSLLYYSTGSVVQQIIHRFKYKEDQDLAIFMGRLMGMALKESERFSNLQGIIPVPLHPKKLRIRGYNQSQLLSEGISEILNVPVFSNSLIRIDSSETQTHKNRMERWENVSGLFSFRLQETSNTKPLLIVDDVMTTGATLEACTQAILNQTNIDLHIATLAFAAQ